MTGGGLFDADSSGVAGDAAAAPETVPTAQTTDVGGTGPLVTYTPGIALDDAVPLADDVAAARATAYAVYDTRLGRYVSPLFTDPADGRDYGATRSGRYRLRRV